MARQYKEILSPKERSERSREASKDFLGNLKPSKPSARERLSESLGVIRERAPEYVGRVQHGARSIQRGARSVQRFGREFARDAGGSRRVSTRTQGKEGVVYVPVYGRTLAKQKKRKPRESNPFDLNLNLPDFDI